MHGMQLPAESKKIREFIEADNDERVCAVVNRVLTSIDLRLLLITVGILNSASQALAVILTMCRNCIGV